MDYYANEIERAYKSFLGCLAKQNTIVEAIGKVRGSYASSYSDSTLKKHLQNYCFWSILGVVSTKKGTAR